MILTLATVFFLDEAENTTYCTTMSFSFLFFMYLIEKRARKKGLYKAESFNPSLRYTARFKLSKSLNQFFYQTTKNALLNNMSRPSVFCKLFLRVYLIQHFY